jgi:uncharacterized protein YneF (UPF0154 family)
MSELETVISVLGTLGGLLVGYWISTRIETKRERHENEMEYRKAIAKRMDDIITPLYGFVEELWRSLSVLKESVNEKPINEEMTKEMLLRVQKAQKNLSEFYSSNETLIDILLPYSLETWVFHPLEMKINAIVVQVRIKEKPISEITQVINALMKYQGNMKRLLGFETDKKFENVYPFT